MKEASIDLETLGTNQDCVILSIGATLFDFTRGEIGESFYIKLDKDLQFNRTVDDGTLAFWKKQDKEVYQEAISGKADICEALEQLSTWLPKNCVAWGNGATFDVSILEHAYKSLGLKVPWIFWNINDMRTIVRLAKDIAGFNKKSIKFMGSPHRADDDATHQARVMIAAYNSLNGGS